MTTLETYSHINFTCMRASCEHVVRIVRDVLLGKSTMNFIETNARVDLTEIYTGSPITGEAHSRKVMLFAPRSAPNATVLFTNLADGWQTLSVCLSIDIPTRVYRFAFSSNEDKWPLFRLEVLSAGETIRHVSAIKDVNDWKFWQTGEPLPEEDVAIYRKRRIRDRLTREYIVSCAERLGFPISEDRFWQSDTEAVLFEEEQV